MKYKNFFKLFTLVFIFIIFAIPVFAEISETNILSKIEIDHDENNSYRISLFFNEKYTGNAFIQNKHNGSYFVFIPDTIINPKNTKIIYNDKKDKSNIKLDIEQKPFIKENYQSSYLRLSVNMSDNYSLKLVSKTIQNKNDSTAFLSLNLLSLMLIILAAAAIFIISKVIKITGNNKGIRSYTAYPAGYLNNSKNYYETEQKQDDQNILKPVLPKVNIRKTLKSHDSDSFSCFDIPLTDDSGQTAFEFKSTLKQTSVIQKEKNAKSKQTNPISKLAQDDSSELALPVAEDIIKLNPSENKKEEKPVPELLSELKITPTIGFYLTTSDDSFALFGFVNDKLFLLKKFTDLSQINLQARFYDKHINNDLYIVRLDSYKAMIEISATEMKELAVL